jgi:hypothetical protein
MREFIKYFEQMSVFIAAFLLSLVYFLMELECRLPLMIIIVEVAVVGPELHGDEENGDIMTTWVQKFRKV